MYSSLKSCDELIEILRIKALFYYIIGYEFYMLVRNPMDRILSFYKNKFIVTNNKDQDSIRLFGTNEIGINQMVEKLPSVYMKDGHLYPQVKSQGIFIKSFGIFLPFNTTIIFRMESDIKTMENFFEINIPHKNSTTGTYVPELTNRSKKIIEEIYQEDYERYGYNIVDAP
jgi:hypothetical protein